MYFEKPMNIQLFAEGQGATTEASETTNAQPQSTQTSQPTSTVSKELYDKTASEVAELKRQLRELQKTGKSEAELKELDIKEKDAELQRRNEELVKLYVELNRANAKSILAETQAKFNLKDASLLDNAIEAIVTDNGDLTKKRAENLNSLLKAVYDKAVADIKSNQWASMSNGIKSGNSSVNEEKQRIDFIKSITPQMPNVDDIKSKFKK